MVTRYKKKLFKIKKYLNKNIAIAVLSLITVFLGGIVLLKQSYVPVKNTISEAIYGYRINPDGSRNYSKIQTEVQSAVLPKNGIKTKITLGDTIPKLVSYGVIDIKKIEELYKSRGGLSAEQKAMLTSRSTESLIINEDNAVWLVNMLWPLGLANKMDINNKSPVAGKDVNNFASTGGWGLGKEENGGVYFNKFEIVALNTEQEKRVKKIAESIYRPCCNNSTFFQDCNHGSAALALIEIGVSQKLSDKEIYKTILAFNSFWFPQNYIETALHFKAVKNKNWNQLDPKLILSKEYSSIGGWIANVDTPARKIAGLLPQQEGGGSCGT